jgi:transcriptional regulator with XRE-family HTH domain
MGPHNKQPSALRLERFLRGVTLRDLEQATGRSRMYWSRVENDGSAVLTPDAASKAAAVLGVTPADLFENGGDR